MVDPGILSSTGAATNDSLPASMSSTSTPSVASPTVLTSLTMTPSLPTSVASSAASLSSSPRTSMPASTMVRLRNGGYSILALAMRIKYAELTGLQNVHGFPFSSLLPPRSFLPIPPPPLLRHLPTTFPRRPLPDRSGSPPPQEPHQATLLGTILANLGFQELAMAVPALVSSASAATFSGPDSSHRTRLPGPKNPLRSHLRRLLNRCGRPSRPEPHLRRRCPLSFLLTISNPQTQGKP